jgi:hypothetical protein
MPSAASHLARPAPPFQGAPAPRTPRRGATRARRRALAASVRASSADDEGPSSPLAEPNATWDAASSETGLSAQLRATNDLRARLSAALFDIRASDVDPEVVYTSQVHEARGAGPYLELMRAWKPLVRRTLTDFAYDCERAFCPEPGVLLVRWRAEWDGAFNADAAMLEFVEKNFPDYDGEELDKLKLEVDDSARAFTGEREYCVRGITTVRVNREGKITRHEDRIVEKGEAIADDAPRGSGSFDDASNDDATMFGGFGGVPSDAELDAEEKAARDEFATTVFYNALKPPGEGNVKWFFEVLLELEWQYFRRQVGDDTTMIASKEEFVNTIVTLLVGVVVVPSALIAFAVFTSLSSPGGLGLGGGDEYDAMIQQANSADQLAATKTQAPTLDADLLRSIYGAKIGL